MQNGGMFWDVISTSVIVDGKKKYLKAYSQDSNFLRDDIMHFLNSRAWEYSQPVRSQAPGHVPPMPPLAYKDEDLPF
jgi:hypothetical protein